MYPFWENLYQKTPILAVLGTWHRWNLAWGCGSGTPSFV